MSYWLDNAAKRGTHILVDCGYVNNPKTQEHADALLKIVSRRNLEIVYCGRVLVRIPPQKLPEVLASCPEIKEGESYSWCTHVWRYEGFNSLEYAIR